MAIIYLGISGSELTLPHTITESLPTTLDKKVTSATMSDGSVRYSLLNSQRLWTLNWPRLSPTDLATLQTLWGYNAVLHYQNNDESASWYNVVITKFSYDVINPFAMTPTYTASMTLEQVA